MTKPPESTRRGQGFTPAAKLLQSRIRAAGESRGFAVSRLLTHWEEVVGPALAAACRPAEIRYGREGMGATLTVLAQGPQAPMVDMARDQIRDRVNACYGYRAIARVRVTQTAPTGFAEGQATFGQMPKARPAPPPVDDRAIAAAEGVADTELRLALAALAANVLRKTKR